MAGDRVGVLVPPPVYPLAGLAAAYLLGRWIPLATVPVALRVGGAVLAVAAITLALWAVTTLWRHRTPIDPYRPTTAVVAAGPYRWSRNPIYVGFVFGTLGLGLAAGWIWAAPMTPLVLLALHAFVVRREERYLARKFGPAYAAYRGQVRRWL